MVVLFQTNEALATGTRAKKSLMAGSFSCIEQTKLGQRRARKLPAGKSCIVLNKEELGKRRALPAVKCDVVLITREQTRRAHKLPAGKGFVVEQTTLDKQQPAQTAGGPRLCCLECKTLGNGRAHELPAGNGCCLNKKRSGPHKSPAGSDCLVLNRRESSNRPGGNQSRPAPVPLSRENHPGGPSNLFFFR